MPEQFQNRDISLELKESYLDYAMSVIVSRALPDARDGLKPVQRRILYAMNDLGLNPSAKFRKSATVVGEVLGKYHPHGDIAVYDALARMAQDFSLREPLINGQGNFGSVDGDPPAAMRYTEVKLNAIAQSLLEDIDEETVDFVPNYDGSRTEPTVLPNRVPQLLLNGAMGIAVGMATNIPPHNLNETIDASIYLIDHPQANSSDLVKFVLGPDFPTGGTIYGQENIAEIYASGRGTVLCRGKAEIEEENKYRQIVITELPYLVNKAELVAKIANLAEEKKIEGIKDLRDESDKEGLRITIDLKNEAIPKKILNQLYKYTDLEKPFHVNMLALIDKGIQPSVLSIKELISEFLNHRKEVIFRRTQFRLKKAKERAHILEGLAKALDHIDEIIKLIRSADDKADAQKKLISKFSFSEIQANAILEMRLSNLAKLERNNIEKELAEKKKIIKEFELILKESKRIFEIIKKELQESKEKYGSPRRTRVVSQMPDSISDDDLIVQKEVIITLSKTGYIKRMAPENLKAQKRGGKGVIAYESKNEEDFIEQLVSCSTHDQLIFFTDKGKAFQTKVYEIDEASRTSRGKAIQNFLSLPPTEKVTVMLNYDPKNNKDVKYLIMATKKGVIKKTVIAEYENARKNGLLSIKLNKDDNLRWAGFCSGQDEIILATKKGQAIRFSEKDCRPMGRVTAGVTGIRLSKDDEVISMSIIKDKNNVGDLLVVSSKGFGKRTKIKDYRKQKRGGTGIKTAKVTEKTGEIVNARLTNQEEDIISISEQGQIIKSELNTVPILSRMTQGVRIMKLSDNDHLVGITLL